MGIQQPVQATLLQLYTDQASDQVLQRFGFIGHGHHRNRMARRHRVIRTARCARLSATAATMM